MYQIEKRFLTIFRQTDLFENEVVLQVDRVLRQMLHDQLCCNTCIVFKLNYMCRNTVYYMCGRYMYNTDILHI